MEIGPETIRTIVERPLSQSEFEGLLRGLDDAGKAQLLSRVCLERCGILRNTQHAPGMGRGVVGAKKILKWN
jgi:hypothetical protein